VPTRRTVTPDSSTNLLITGAVLIVGAAITWPLAVSIVPPVLLLIGVPILVGGAALRLVRGI
jgi:hypothetical protein